MSPTWLFLGVLALSMMVTLVVSQLASRSLAASGISTPFNMGTEQSLRPELGAVGLQALAESATVRVAARTCDGLTRGSGFVVDGELVTNRHLTTGASELKVDDPIAPVFVPVVRRSDSLDISLAEAVPSLGLRWSPVAPEGGDPVWVAGHAEGGPVVVRPATVQTTVPDGSFGLGGPVLVLEVETVGGFSGGPVLDRYGDVVGVLQGFDLTTGSTLAIPASAVVDWVSSGASAQPTPCPADN